MPAAEPVRTQGLVEQCSRERDGGSAGHPRRKVDESRVFCNAPDVVEAQHISSARATTGNGLNGGPKGLGLSLSKNAGSNQETLLNDQAFTPFHSSDSLL